MCDPVPPEKKTLPPKREKPHLIFKVFLVLTGNTRILIEF
jgi:hypothetical protein